ncbi:MAG: hypothetical protein NTW94_02445 [Legionellales bacterium]|nr:hypothetical protein [Legionellales bacterium]
MTFLKKVLTALPVEETLFSLDEIQVQNKLADTLRQAAIHHLKTGQGVLAGAFRGEYLATRLDTDSIPAADYVVHFLQKQAKDGEWGTYIEAGALGELLGCSVMVTPIKKDGVSQEPMCLYRAPTLALGVEAPVVQLKNYGNTHWAVNNHTLGDGNCLYNAFAQALQTLVRPELAIHEPLEVAHAPSHHDLSPDDQQAVIELVLEQKRIMGYVLKHPTPVEMETELSKEKVRISALPIKEQQQIEADHRLALELASEDMGYVKRNFFHHEPDFKKRYELSMKAAESGALDSQGHTTSLGQK